MGDWRDKTGGPSSGRILVPMKRPSFPLWLLRDVPAFMGLIVSFWTLIIVAMTSGCRAASASQRVRDHFALLLALTEARLDYALWREAYRRLGWSPRDIQLQVFAPAELWSDTHARLLSFANAFRNMNAVVDAYVGHLRAQYNISKRDLAALGSTGAAFHASAHHEVGVGCDAQTLFPLMVSSALCARLSNHEGQQRAPPGAMGSRGPPITPNANHPPRRRHLRERTRMPLASSVVRGVHRAICRARHGPHHQEMENQVC